MLRFAANLTMLWQELDPFQRFEAAASAGFTRVEMLFPHELDSDRLRNQPSASSASLWSCSIRHRGLGGRGARAAGTPGTRAGVPPHGG